MTQDFLYTTPAGNELPITLYGASHYGSGPCVLYVHGFKGFKDWGFVPYVGERFAESGIAFVAFNFSHNGIGADMQQFTETEKFAQNSYSLEVSEVAAMIHAVVHTDLLGSHLTGKLGLLGHSRGGGVALLSAAQSRDVDAVTTWASISTIERYDKDILKKWKAQGHHEVKNSRTGQVFQLGMDLYKDITQKGQDELNILQAAQNLHKPLLVIHGQQDESVPFFEGEQINIFAEPTLTSFQLIPGGSHTFGATHPFSESTSALDNAVASTIAFFEEHLA
ncbi:prolyl oligopeptidase family serine peptidase [Pontibacter sp. G13]|uniref:alpha/beta hydrolase family protein n=1 Tax=Pontibacter sp. G13 TaxID=3074898 RepID=UPI00288BA09A|nr:prolyl oligopeptidase family serine peptidase [Pontibacter sp. G13]WNJ21038.1 prolyl oligopeptidase family serine peptidase [Pontibacter sp. G13]